MDCKVLPEHVDDNDVLTMQDVSKKKLYKWQRYIMLMQVLKPVY